LLFSASAHRLSGSPKISRFAAFARRSERDQKLIAATISRFPATSDSPRQPPPAQGLNRVARRAALRLARASPVADNSHSAKKTPHD
jgi:hypothetical protein